MTPTLRLSVWFPSLLLLVSGAAALVYQVVWIKQLALIVGVDVHAIAAGVSAFFAGLALGNWLFGTLADRWSSPLRLYAFLELGVAVLGVLATIGLSISAPVVAQLDTRLGVLSWTLPLLLVAAPAVLMGGTLPAMVRVASLDSSAAWQSAGRLYAANTAGAVLGVLLPSFVLIPRFGVKGTARVAVAANLLAAAGALILAGVKPRRHVLDPDPDVCGGSASPLDDSARAALRLYAVAGGVALGYEVVWSQVIVQFTSTRAFAFAVVLATYLTGLTLGSALYARGATRFKDPWAAFGLLIGLAGLASLLTVSLLGYWVVWLQSFAEWHVLEWTSSRLAGMCARFAVAAAVVVLPPTLLLGAAFPAAMRLVAGPTGRNGRDIGLVLALNTAGGIAGTLLTGFVLIPALGLVRTLATLALLATIVGVIAVRRKGSHGAPRLAVIGVAGITLAVAVATPADRVARLLLAARGGGTLAFYGESAAGTVAVVDQPARPAPFRRLYIQGVSNSGDAMSSLRYMRLQALLPLIVHRGEPRSALVIGLGTGITSGALLAYPGLERRVCAELMPAVAQAAHLFNGNFDVTSDRRVEIRIVDGRRELLRRTDRYDLITLEPPPPSAAGVNNLYSRDFYELALGRLNPDGLVAQWWPLPTQNDEDSRSLVQSFLQAFPYAHVWTTELHEMLLVGSKAPLQLDAARIATRFDQPEVAAALSEVGIGSAADLIALWVTDRDGLSRYAGMAPAATDDRPTLEYASWVRPGEFARVAERILVQASDPPLVNATPEFTAQVAGARERLVAFYQGMLLASRGERVEASRVLSGVRTQDPQNPYILWMLGTP